MAMMVKMHATLTEEQAAAVEEIERREDRPRTRIMRRAIEEYIEKYRQMHPDFVVAGGTPERLLKESLQTDVVAIGGKKVVVILEGDGGWRKPVEEDYVTAEPTTSVIG